VHSSPTCGGGQITEHQVAVVLGTTWPMAAETADLHWIRCTVRAGQSARRDAVRTSVGCKCSYLRMQPADMRSLHPRMTELTTHCIGELCNESLPAIGDRSALPSEIALLQRFNGTRLNLAGTSDLRPIAFAESRKSLNKEGAVSIKVVQRISENRV
jgi:hypothetical protein